MRRAIFKAIDRVERWTDDKHWIVGYIAESVLVRIWTWNGGEDAYQQAIYGDSDA